MTGFELRTSGIKATALPTEPQPLPLVIVLIRNGGSKWPILKHAKGSFTLTAAVCGFRSGLRQRRDRNFLSLRSNATVCRRRTRKTQ